VFLPQQQKKNEKGYPSGALDELGLCLLTQTGHAYLKSRPFSKFYEARSFGFESLRGVNGSIFAAASIDGLTVISVANPDFRCRSLNRNK